MRHRLARLHRGQTIQPVNTACFTKVAQNGLKAVFLGKLAKGNRLALSAHLADVSFAV